MSGTLCWCGWGPVSTPWPSSSSSWGGSASAPSRASAAAAAPWVGRASRCDVSRELLCLEWLLQEAIGIKITGYEVNRSWWEGTHSIPHFIDISELQKLQISESNKTKTNYFRLCWRAWGQKLQHLGRLCSYVLLLQQSPVFSEIPQQLSR